LIAPPLHDIEHDYWQAFSELSGDRQMGGPIPWSAIRRYYEVEGFGSFDTFKRIIMTMDRAFLEANKPDE